MIWGRTERDMRIIRSDEDVAAGLSALVENDPRLRPIAREAGPLPLRLREPGFEGLAHVIVSQMVSRASADAIWKRMLPAEGPLTSAYYAGLAGDDWRTFGLSRAKAETLLRIATAVEDGVLDLHSLSAMPPAEALLALTAIKGVGPWTAEVYLMFCGGHADVFPAGDVALQAAVGMAFEYAARPSPKALREISADWAPWRSVAARLFWAYYAVKMRRDGAPIG